MTPMWNTSNAEINRLIYDNKKKAIDENKNMAESNYKNHRLKPPGVW